MNGQLSLFGTAPDQQTYQSTTWGTLHFCPTASTKWTDTCRHCLLWVQKPYQRPDDECLNAPCNSEDREDGLNGYFSIQEMPKPTTERTQYDI